jgi:hypothetical protein
MTEYNKFNLVYRLQKWMDSVPGQTFLNYAYSWGASIVILGTLFKLTHLPGANTMLFIGMGTEVFVFFLSAFDRPFDKTAEGRNLPTHVTEQYLEGEDQPSEAGPSAAAGTESGATADEGHAAAAFGATPSGTVSGGARPAVQGAPYIVGGAATQNGAPFMGPDPTAGAGRPATAEEASVAASAGETGGQGVTGEAPEAGAAAQPAAAAQSVVPNFVPQMSAEQAEALNEAQGNYVEELKKLVETLGKVNEQSTRLTRDSEEMENLNRTLTGITKIYEMQLKGASQQVGTIDQINDQTRRMAQQIEQLNSIYARMIEAMTVNMRAAAPTAAPGQAPQNPAGV